MKKEIFFSIIVPVYNTEIEFIRECLFSLLNIQYSRYEIIIIDDGSDTKTKEYIDTYKNKNKIHIFHQNNLGQFKSRVNGITHSNGDYILFVDSDDALLSDSLSKLNDVLSKKQYDMVLFGYSRFKNNTDNIIYKHDYFSSNSLKKEQVIIELLSLHINGVCLKCVKKTIAQNIEYSINTNIREGEDSIQSAYYIANSNIFYYLNEHFYLYRLNENTKSYYGKNNICNINFLVSIYNIFFKGDKYKELIGLFKKNAIKSSLDCAFRICKTCSNNNERSAKLDELNRQETINVIKKIYIKTFIPLEFIFNCLLKRKYRIIYICSKIYFIFIKV